MTSAATALLAILIGLAPYTAASSGDWPYYGADAGGSKYSPLGEITRANVKDLSVAWTFHTGDSAAGFKSADKRAFEATPLMVDGTLYLSTPTNRVIALDPVTGKQRWTFDPKIDPNRSYSEMASRGVSYWKGRIFVATLDARLIALDAKTGAAVKAFGKDGAVDLSRGVRLRDKGDYQVTSPPAVVNDTLVVGSSIGDNRGVELERGVVRAFDAKTGRQLWSWDPIPVDAKDPAATSWKSGSAERTGAANAWSIISADPKRGVVYVPTSSPSPDYYGGERLGANNYANSVVALDARSGRVIWSFQVVHHDLWDYDVASQPSLATVERGGKPVDAVVVATKIGHLFVLDRDTGKPIFPVEERAVPKSDVPGEEASPTQPFPTAMDAVTAQSITPDEAWGPTEKDCDWCRKRISELRNEGVFTPPSLGGTIAIPGNVGGAHWGGMAIDPVRKIVVVPVNRLPAVIRLIPRKELESAVSEAESNRLQGEFGRQTGTPYAMYRELLRSPSGAPCIAPPWGVLVAVDLVTGKKKWAVPLGSVQLPGLPKTPGSPNLGGAITTAGGLVFVGATMDHTFHAFDVETGKEVWSAELPACAHATPMTYRAANGKQYVVVAAGGHGKLGEPLGDAVVAYTLPDRK